MRRAIFEWGAIVGLALSGLCFACWVISFTSDVADFETFLPLGHWRATQIKIANGAVEVFDNPTTTETIEAIERPRGRPFRVGLFDTHEFEFPGFKLHYIEWWAKYPATWTANCSLLLPSLVLLLPTGFCIWQYHRFDNAVAILDLVGRNSTCLKVPRLPNKSLRTLEHERGSLKDSARPSTGL